MRIGIVTTWFPAGAGYVSRAYREELECQGNKVFIYARGGQKMVGDTVWDDSYVTWARRGHIATGMPKRDFQYWIKRNKITHLIFNEQRFWKPLIWAKELGVICGAYIDYYTQVTVDCFVAYDFLLCNTLRHFSVFKWHQGCHYIPWGVDVSKYVPSEKPQLNRLLTFIISSGWEPQWGGDRRGSLLALRAFKECVGECRLIFFTQVPCEQMLNEWRAALKGDNRIEVRCGTFEPFPYCDGDIYLYPSRLDGIGLTLPEALSSGLAAITSNCAPMNEFVTDGVTGRLVDVTQYRGRADGYYWPECLCSMPGLRQAIQDYVDAPELARSHQKVARETMVARRDWHKNGAQLSQIIRQVIFTPLQPTLRELLHRTDAKDAPDFKVLFRQFLKSCWFAIR